VVDLSSSLNEGEPIPDTSCDFEFTQCLFSELNRPLLGPPDDDKIIILSDSNKEKEEVHEEKSTSAKDVAASAPVNPISTTSADHVDAHMGAKKNSDDQGPDQ
jgi:hypothetical protein